MTPDQTIRLIDALESIAFDLSGIHSELDADRQTSAISHLLNTLNRFHINTGGIESSLDQIIQPQLERIADKINNG